MKILYVIGFCVMSACVALSAIAMYNHLKADDQIAEDQLIKMVIGSWQIGYEQSAVACKCFDYEKFKQDSINYSKEINKILK